MADQDTPQESSCESDPNDDLHLWEEIFQKLDEDLRAMGFKVTDLQPSPERRMVATFINAPPKPPHATRTPAPNDQQPTE